MSEWRNVRYWHKADILASTVNVRLDMHVMPRRIWICCRTPKLAGLRRITLDREEGICFAVKEPFRVGRRSLAIGIPLLIACLVLAHLTSGYLGGRQYERMVEESFLILGIANWRPLEILLYGWWPLAGRRDLYRRLAAASVVSKPYQPAIAPPPAKTHVTSF